MLCPYRRASETHVVVFITWIEKTKAKGWGWLEVGETTQVSRGKNIANQQNNSQVQQKQPK